MWKHSRNTIEGWDTWRRARVREHEVNWELKTKLWYTMEHRHLEKENGNSRESYVQR